MRFLTGSLFYGMRGLMCLGRVTFSKSYSANGNQWFNKTAEV
jgi:hypothetical protein